MLQGSRCLPQSVEETLNHITQSWWFHVPCLLWWTHLPGKFFWVLHIMSLNQPYYCKCSTHCLHYCNQWHDVSRKNALINSDISAGFNKTNITTQRLIPFKYYIYFPSVHQIQDLMNVEHKYYHWVTISAIPKHIILIKKLKGNITNLSVEPNERSYYHSLELFFFHF